MPFSFGCNTSVRIIKENKKQTNKNEINYLDLLNPTLLSELEVGDLLMLQEQALDHPLCKSCMYEPAPWLKLCGYQATIVLFSGLVASF